MKSNWEEYASDIIVLKRPTALDKLADSIAKPEGAVPDFGLPKWKVMPLEAKIPLVPGPKAAYNFTRQKIGKGLWIPSKDAEFNLSDPYCHEMKFDYDPLHDKHLLKYFSKPQNIRHLIKIGQITKSMDAKCSLKDYNMYRKYLRMLYSDSIKKEIHKIWELSIKQRAIDFAERTARKDADRLKKREILMQSRKGIIEKQKQAEKLKLQLQKEKQEKLQERLLLLAERKREEQQKLREKVKARAEAILEKRKAAADIERMKIIKTFVEWRKKEHIRKKFQEMRLTREREEKLLNVEKKWKLRKELQEKDIEKERFLLDCIDNRRKQFIEEYNAKIDKETKRMQKLLEDVKLFVRCYLARRMPANKNVICCEKFATSEQDKKKDRFKALICPKPQQFSTVAKGQEKIKEQSFKVKEKVKEQAPKSSQKQKKISSEPKKQKKQSKKDKAVRDSQQPEAEVTKSQSDTIENTESKSKADTPTVSQSAMFDKCRCEAIKLSKCSKKVAA